jgi:hypothetical protein
MRRTRQLHALLTGWPYLNGTREQEREVQLLALELSQGSLWKSPAQDVEAGTGAQGCASGLSYGPRAVEGATRPKVTARVFEAAETARSLIESVGW